MTIEQTIVFAKNWAAIQEKCPKGCHGDKNCDWCHGSNRKYKYLVNEGSSRSSKTYSIIDIFDLYARRHRNKRGTIWRTSKEEAVSAVLPDIEKRHQLTNRYNVGYTHKLTDNSFHYNNGSRVEFHGADTINRKIGLTQDFAWFNEPYSVSKELFNHVDQRTSDFIFIDWNPKQKHWIDQLKKNRRTFFLKSTFKDNPFCPPNQKAKILGYQPLESCEVVEKGLITEKEAFKYDLTENEKGFSEKQIRELTRCLLNEEQGTKSKFDWEVYGLGNKSEKPNRIFRFQQITDREFDDLEVESYYGVDWGKVDPWGIVQLKYYDGKLYGRELNYLSENEWMDTLTPDQIQEIRQSNEGIVGWLFRKLEIPYGSIIVCDDNRPEKIIALREAGWEYAIAAFKGPGSIVEGIDLVSKLQVFYTESSENLEKEQEEYERKVDRYGVVLEEPVDKNNHTLDPIRYVCQYLRSEGIINII